MATSEERTLIQTLKRSEHRLRGLLEASPGALLLLDPEQRRFIDCNTAAVAMLGCRSRDELLKMSPEACSPAQQPCGQDSAQKFRDAIAKALRCGGNQVRWVHQSPYRQAFPVQVSLTPIAGEGHTLIAVSWQDLSEPERAQAWQRHYNGVLDSVLHGRSIADILYDIAGFVESQACGVLCSILLRSEDGAWLRHGAAPSLDPEYLSAIAELPVEANVGTCPHAVALGETTITESIADDPKWEGFHDAAQRAGLAACWSVPIKDSEGWVVGSLAQYHRRPGRPSELEREAIERSARLAAIAIGHSRQIQQMRLADTVFLHSDEGIVVLDADQVVLRANATFERMAACQSEVLFGHSLADAGVQLGDEVLWSRIERSLIRDQRWHGECTLRRADGSRLPVLCSMVTATDDRKASSHRILIMRDISEYRRQANQIEQLAYTDALTRLPNRTLLMQRLSECLQRARLAGDRLAVLFMDLDRFKEINDTLGHDVGDEVLTEVAARFSRVVGEQGLLGRMGGDEFLLLVEHPDGAAVDALAESLIDAMREPVMVGPTPFSLGLSIGIGFYPEDGETTETLLKNVDIVMYSAKARGGGYAYYEPAMGSALHRSIEISSRLREALAGQKLQLFYQPQVNLADHGICGAEALLRWHDPELGWVSPAEFIPIAEARGMIEPITDWVLAQGCRQLLEWQKQGTPLPGRLSVNISPRQLQQADLGTHLEAVVRAAGGQPALFELELTESCMIDHPRQAIEILSDLARRGFRLAIDDFGTGYSSLAHLKDFSAERLKIDLSFVRDILVNEKHRSIVQAIIAMASSLGMRTVAEGVEVLEQAQLLVELGCDECQGYYFARPMPACELDLASGLSHRVSIGD